MVKSLKTVLLEIIITEDIKTIRHSKNRLKALIAVRSRELGSDY